MILLLFSWSRRRESNDHGYGWVITCVDNCVLLLTVVLSCCSQSRKGLCVHESWRVLLNDREEREFERQWRIVYRAIHGECFGMVEKRESSRIRVDIYIESDSLGRGTLERDILEHLYISTDRYCVRVYWMQFTVVNYLRATYQFCILLSLWSL